MLTYIIEFEFSTVRGNTEILRNNEMLKGRTSNPFFLYLLKCSPKL